MQIDFVRDGESWRILTWKDAAYDCYLATALLLPEAGWLGVIGWIIASLIL